MASANGFLLTSTNQEYYNHPHRTMNAGTRIALTQAISTTDLSDTDETFGFMKIPDGSKIMGIKFSLTDIDTGTDSDIDIVILENIDGTATTTALYELGTLGQAAVTNTQVYPTAANGTYIHQVAATDDGYGVLQLKQTGTADPPRTATAGTFNVIVDYR